MNEHPHDALPALALGALDADEAGQVINHVAACPSCRDDVESWGAVVAMLPYAAPPRDPPVHVKRRLFALVGSSFEAGAAGAAPAPPLARAAQSWRVLSSMAVPLVVMVVVFGAMFFRERGHNEMLAAQMDRMTAEFEQHKREIQQIRSELNQRTQEIQQVRNELGQRNREIQQVSVQLNQVHADTAFIADSKTVGRLLVATRPGAQGMMYMQPGHNHAVLFVQGLQIPEGGKVYQFWLARGNTQVPSGTFTVGQDGKAVLALDAPAPVDDYAQVMVTVEPAGGSQRPSDQVVLQAELTT